MSSLDKLAQNMKGGGKDFGSKIERAKDVSDFFARAFVKHDLMTAAENQGSYIIRDNLGNPILVNPRGGITNLNGAMPMQPSQGAFNLASAPMSIAKSRSDAGPVDFRAIGKSQEPVEDEDAKNKAFNKFVSSLTPTEIENLQQLSKDRILVPKKTVEKLHAKNEEIGVERLIENNLVKWESIPGEGLLEFRITALGRRILQSLG